MEHLTPGISLDLSHGLHDGARLVGGAIIDSDDLQRNALRSQQGAQGRGDIVSFIPRRNNHGHGGQPPCMRITGLRQIGD